MAMICRRHGQLLDAVDILRKLVEVDELVQHSNLESDKHVLDQVEQELEELNG